MSKRVRLRTGRKDLASVAPPPAPKSRKRGRKPQQSVVLPSGCGRRARVDKKNGQNLDHHAPFRHGAWSTRSRTVRVLSRGATPVEVPMWLKSPRRQGP